MDNPLLSIIITTRNRANYLSDCIKSILSSNFTGNFEIIIIDDKSEDDTLSYDNTFLRRKYNFENIAIFHLKKKSMLITHLNYMG